MVGPEALVLVPVDLRRRDERAVLADVVGAADAGEASLDEVVDTAGPEADQVDQDRQVVRVAGHDLDVLVDALLQGAIVDAAGVHLAEPEFRALGDEAQCAVRVLLVDLPLVLEPDVRRSAVDDHGRLAQRLVMLVGRLDTDVAEPAPRRIIARQASTTLDQVDHLGSIGEEGRALVEGDLVEAEQVFPVGEQADEGLQLGPDPSGHRRSEPQRHARRRLAGHLELLRDRAIADCRHLDAHLRALGVLGRSTLLAASARAEGEQEREQSTLHGSAVRPSNCDSVATARR